MTDTPTTGDQLCTAKFYAAQLAQHAAAAYWSKDGTSKYLAGLVHSDFREIAAALGYTVSRADDPEPEPADPETVHAREEAYRRDMIAAGRGHLLGG